METKCTYLVSSLRDVDCASPKLVMSRGFHTGDPTIKRKLKNGQINFIYFMRFDLFFFKLLDCFRYKKSHSNKIFTVFDRFFNF